MLVAEIEIDSMTGQGQAQGAAQQLQLQHAQHTGAANSAPPTVGRTLRWPCEGRRFIAAPAARSGATV